MSSTDICHNMKCVECTVVAAILRRSEEPEEIYIEEIRADIKEVETQV